MFYLRSELETSLGRSAWGSHYIVTKCPPKKQLKNYWGGWAQHPKYVVNSSGSHCSHSLKKKEQRCYNYLGKGAWNPFLLVKGKLGRNPAVFCVTATARNHFSHLLEIRLHPHKGHNKNTTERCRTLDSWLQLADQTDQSDVDRGNGNTTEVNTYRDQDLVASNHWQLLGLAHFVSLTAKVLPPASGCLPWLRTHFLSISTSEVRRIPQLCRHWSTCCWIAWTSMAFVFHGGWVQRRRIDVGRAKRVLGHAVAQLL